MKLGDLAEALKLPLHGDPSVELSALAPVQRAGPNDLAFVVSARYESALPGVKAGAIILPENLRLKAPGNCLVSEDPYASYAEASWLLKPAIVPAAGQDPTALIDVSARVAPTAHIGAGVVIGADCVIGEDVVIEPYCVLGPDVRVGANSYLFARVTLYSNVWLDEQCRVQSGAILGSEGFGFARTRQGWSQIQQTGGVRVGRRVHIGANTTIDCGAIDPTVIADGVILDNQIQVAHNVQIGENTAIAGCVGIAGSTRIGRDCQIGGACNIVGHITITDKVILNAASLVSRSIEQPGRYGSGSPLQAEPAWRRSFATLPKLPELIKRVRKLERKLDSD